MKEKAVFDKKKFVVIIVCILLYVAIVMFPTPDGLTVEGKKSLALMAVAVISWIFEVIPIGLSASLFVMIMPTLGIVSMEEAMSNFMIATVLFIMSTFIIAHVFVETGLGKRVSLFISTLFGKKSSRVLLSYMLSTSLISGVLLSIPAAIIFAGVATTLLKKNNCTPGKSNFGKQMMIGIPVAAAIGGIGTPAGSGLNVLAISLLESTAGVTINFFQWTMVGFPMAIILTLIAWFIIMKMIPSEIDIVQGLDDVKEEAKKLGKLTTAEKKFLVIFSIELILWLTQPWNGINTAVVAIIATSLFFIPGVDLCTWEKANKSINWELLLLVGGSNSLAMAISSTQGSQWLANAILGGLVDSPILVVLFAVTAFGVFSHLLIPVSSAVIVVAVPMVALLAQNIGINPALLVLPIAFTASDVFLMPLDPIPLTTYHYGHWKMWDMMKPGFIISMAWIILCVGFVLIAQALGIV
ncbi:SLC13 family permease [Candidatus Enterococcus clewellii]|uniref:Sodium-dependent dicarboxylate transporter SdcS n=1 Tax=Candidatus Enterococcus clewellii TaxID=1834193 RepID=A0A242KB90_9ENTE|nr:DASS family sodium-coupled anion symporter [Enterococcus sp. 9E7_DIV0242]OTP18339.1 hypothetical protein A5888_000153 [Enterococcus sp. 9E7_DIV0242]